jgi:hypothetical protein
MPHAEIDQLRSISCLLATTVPGQRLPSTRRYNRGLVNPSLVNHRAVGGLVGAREIARLSILAGCTR